MDVIYKISDVLLYDNQIEHDYIFLFPDVKNYLHGGFLKDIPYRICVALKDIDKIQRSYKEVNTDVVEIDIMTKAFREEGLLFIKNDNILTHSKIEGAGTHMPNYNGYDILWNETRSDINVLEHDNVGCWSPGRSDYSSYDMDRGPNGSEHFDTSNKARNRVYNLVSLLDT